MLILCLTLPTHRIRGKTDTTALTEVVSKAGTSQEIISEDGPTERNEP